VGASFDAPKRKSGLWKIKMSSGQTKGMPARQQCVDEKTDDVMQKEMGERQKMQCSKNEMRKEKAQRNSDKFIPILLRSWTSAILTTIFLPQPTPAKSFPG
jgi:hypothetical protein